MNKDKKLVFGILALLVSIVAVSISYAAFTQNLNINGVANVQASNWSVHFANLTNGVRNGTAVEQTAPTIKSGQTSIGDYSVDFYTPGDSITYTFDVVNDGDYDAKISVLAKGTPTCTGSDSTSNTNVCNNLEYTLTYTTGGAAVAQNDALRKNETKNMTLVLRYKTTIGQNELPTATVNISNLGITIQYAQASLYDGVNTEVPKLTYINRQNSGQITSGDEVAIDTEHFYVVSSDSTNTVLLAKYNLLVGDVYNKSGDTWSFTKTLSSSDTGYGLQSESAKGYYGNSATDITGVVAFAGKGYWDNANCVGSNVSTSILCPETAGLKSEYSNPSNPSGTTTYTSPYPYVYDSSMSNISVSYMTYPSSSGNWRGALDNGYTIAYYVEEYVDILKGLGAPSTITGRLLTNEERNTLSSTVKGTWSYWLGSTNGSSSVMHVYRGGASSVSGFRDGRYFGVRPVIVVSTSDI